jgi:hypothetical protein
MRLHSRQNNLRPEPNRISLSIEGFSSVGFRSTRLLVIVLLTQTKTTPRVVFHHCRGSPGLRGRRLLESRRPGFELVVGFVDIVGFKYTAAKDAFSINASAVRPTHPE